MTYPTQASVRRLVADEFAESVRLRYSLDEALERVADAVSAAYPSPARYEEYQNAEGNLEYAHTRISDLEKGYRVARDSLIERKHTILDLEAQIRRLTGKD